eukprot:4726104-Prymnesium_polylepis.2
MTPHDDPAAPEALRAAPARQRRAARPSSAPSRPGARHRAHKLVELVVQPRALGTPGIVYP